MKKYLISGLAILMASSALAAVSTKGDRLMADLEWKARDVAYVRHEMELVTTPKPGEGAIYMPVAERFGPAYQPHLDQVTYCRNQAKFAALLAPVAMISPAFVSAVASATTPECKAILAGDVATLLRNLETWVNEHKQARTQ